MRAPLVVVLCALAALPPATAGAQGLDARDASVEEASFTSEDRVYPASDAGGAPGTATWRVVLGAGNCCETYLTTSSGGRLFDFGGNYVNYSDDRGITWMQVRPEENFIGGEGAIVEGPNGDILGVGWDPYTGDVLLAFRYDAAAGKWRYKTMPLKTPFYDREWIGVVPGPILVEGQSHPWISFVKGGYPTKEDWLFSTDGLTYAGVSSKFTDSTTGDTVKGPLAPQGGAMFDTIQANGGMGLAPLGGGRALAEPDVPDAPYALLDPDSLTWSAFEFPGEAPTGEFHADSRGRLHNLVAPVANDFPVDTPGGGEFEYRISEDGGMTWRSTKVRLPDGVALEVADFRVHAALGIAAVAVRASDRDLLYKLDVRGPQPALLRSYEVGLGDLVAGSNVLSTGPRFDFESLAIFPDGRVAVSFMDSETGDQPAIGIELSDPVPPGFTASPTPAPGPIAAPPKPVRPGGPTDPHHRVTMRARRRGGRVVVTGTVRPAHGGHRVAIQRRRGSRWVTVARVRANRRSAFRATLRLRGRVSLRAVASRDRTHGTGRSRPVAVR